MPWATYRIGIACVFLAAATVFAGEGIHITGGSSIGFNWNINDGAGYRWDISSYGTVSNGTNNAYSGGMQLQVNNSGFHHSGSGRRSKDGREVEIGPWNYSNRIHVYRRIYVDPKRGYARWIDIFQNVTGMDQVASVRYSSYMGSSVKAIHTNTGKGAVGNKDWGVITVPSSTSRPHVVHVFAGRSVKVRPGFRWQPGNNTVYCDVSLKIPAGKTVALCFFQAQVRGTEAAKKFLTGFRPEAEVQKVPRALRKILVNMGAATVNIGSLELRRETSDDLVVLRNNDELKGMIQNETFAVETFYGRLDLPAKRVVGLLVPAADDPHVLVGLTDGQVVGGKLLSGPVKLRLANGNGLSFPIERLRSAAFRVSPGRPERITTGKPTIVLRSGQQLAFTPGDVDYTFHTQSGRVKLSGEDLLNIHTDTPGGGLHRAVFRNGSVLSGLLSTEQLDVRLDLGPKLRVSRHLVAQFAFPWAPVANDELAAVELRNEDAWFGRIMDAKLTIETRDNRVTIAPDEIASMEFPAEEGFGVVKVALHNGTKISGKLVERKLRFKIEPGPEVSVFAGHVLRINFPEPPEPDEQKEYQEELQAEEDEGIEKEAKAAEAARRKAEEEAAKAAEAARRKAEKEAAKAGVTD